MPLLLVGVGHVFRIEEPIRALIEAERPDLVALELDPPRFQALLQRAAGQYDREKAQRDAPRAYRALARLQEDLAGQLGTDVGGEMLAAARAAQVVGSRLALIDRSAEETVRRLWKQMSLWEKVRLFGSSLVARFQFRRAKSVEKEIARYQENPASYLEEIGGTYPTLKRVLLDERNEHMAAQLRAHAAAHPKVVAIVGDGHVDGLLRLLTDLRPGAVRLAELRKAAPGGVAWRFDPNGQRVGFSFTQKSPEGELRRGP